jgi:hypothetical protein
MGYELKLCIRRISRRKGILRILERRNNKELFQYLYQISKREALKDLFKISEF